MEQKIITKKPAILVKDIKIFMDFLNHKSFWLHIFKPTINGEYQKGDLKSLFSTKRDLIIEEIKKFNGKGLICQAINEREEGKTKGEDVKNIDTFAFDIDVKKNLKVNYVSTHEHHKHAVNKAEEIKLELERLGFSVGLKVDSGNGSQLYLKSSLNLTKNRNEIIDKLSLIENYLKSKFNDDIIEIDCITKDVNRRMKIPGTINKKDIHQSEDRVSRIIYKNDLDLQEQEIQNNKTFFSFNEEISEERVRVTLNGKGLLETSGTDESRSAFEYRRVLALSKQGKTKQEIFNEMNKYSKWVSSPEQYKELTYKKASAYIESQKIDKEEYEKINVMNYRSLMDFKIKPIQWLIKDQIPQGEVGILAGKRGEGKTWIALKQAIGICSGKKVFGDIVPEKKKVMIIDEESGEGILAKRLQLLANAEGIQKEELDLISVSFTGLKLDQLDIVGNNKAQEFAEIIYNFKPDLIIVDCLQRVCGFDIDKENSMISTLFTEVIRPLIKKYGMSWLFVHHLRKSPTGNNSNSGDPLDEIRGGSELVNYCRFVLGVSQPKNQGKQEDGSIMMVFKILKMSNSNIPDAKVINFQPNSPNPDDNTEIKMDYIGKCEDVLRTEIRVANAIKDYLFSEGIKGEFTTGEITDNKQKIGFEKTFISKGLKELWDEGFLEKVKRGVWIISDDISKQTTQTNLKASEVPIKNGGKNVR